MRFVTETAPRQLVVELFDTLGKRGTTQLEVQIAEPEFEQSLILVARPVPAAFLQRASYRHAQSNPASDRFL